jgi:hypothetical protein
MKSKDKIYTYVVESKDQLLRHYLNYLKKKEVYYCDAKKFDSKKKAEDWIKRNRLEDLYEVTEHEEIDWELKDVN